MSVRNCMFAVKALNLGGCVMDHADVLHAFCEVESVENSHRDVESTIMSYENHFESMNIRKNERLKKRL
jgi:hypothetical protein